MITKLFTSNNEIYCDVSNVYALLFFLILNTCLILLKYMFQLNNKKTY